MNPFQQPYMYGGFPVRFGPPPYGVPMPPMPPMPHMGMMPTPMVPIPKPPAPMPTPMKIIEQTTTVYVGKIPPTVEDEFIKKLLEFCGDVAFWRRVTDPTTGQLKGFAFCDFKSPEGVLRALRLLNGLEIDEHQLLLKVDEKNQKLLDSYIAKRNAEQHGITLKPGDTIAQTAEALGREKEEDDKTNATISDLVGRVHRVLSARRAGKDPAEEDIADGDPTKEDKAQMVSRQIKNFRERQAQRDLEIKDREVKDREERDRHGGHAEFDRQKEIDRLRLLRDREREKDIRRRRDDRDREREWEQTERIRERKRDDLKRRDRRERDARRREIEEQEYDSDEKAKKRLRARDARKRMIKEREEDELDRIKEREEIEQKKRADEEKVKAEEQARLAQEAQEAEKKRIDQQQQQRAILLQQQHREHQLQQQQLKEQQQQLKEAQKRHESPEVSTTTEENTSVSSLKLGFNKRAKIMPVAGFAVDAEEDQVVVKKKPLVMLDQPEHKDNQNAGKGGKLGGRKDEVQSVIDLIPTTKEELFCIEIDWPLIEKHKITEKKMKPWVTKKIMEYLGEEEKTLIDFIMGKITTHTPPAEILQQLALVLDDEADMFVVKMWRMLVYEMKIAAK